jgi:hypothetical protein
MDYHELNKATLEYHFPLPFIDQVLDTLESKIFFLIFLMKLVVIIKFKLVLKIKIRLLSPTHGEHMLAKY